MVFGFDNVETADRELMDNLAFVCYDESGSSKASYYRKLLLKDYLDNVESDMLSVSVKPFKVVAGGPMDSAWPMQSHDNRHTGRSPYSTASNTGTEKWRFSTDGSVDGGPVIDNNGTIYFGGNYGGLPWYLFAVYPNGTVKWRYKTGGLVWSTPAIAEDGTIYIGSWNDYLYAINPDGTRKWRFLTYDNIASSPAVADDGTIYLGTGGDKRRIYAVNPNGTENWYYTTCGDITSDPAIGNDGTVYIGSMDDYLYAIYPNGTLRWRFETDHYVKGPPSIAEDGTIYIGSWDDYLYALNPNGTMKWKCKVGSGTETTPAIASDGTIYVGGDKLWAIYPNGTMRWSFDLGSNRHIHMSCPAISADGTIYVGTNIGDAEGGDIIAVNPNGTEKWRKKIATDWVDSSPCIAEDGTVYIGGTYDLTWGFGYLHAFGAVESNNPPEAPTITGPTNGEVRQDYTYTFVAHDPDNNPISCYIEWGDGTTTGWTREYASGEQVKIEHTWSRENTYTIRVKAKDVLGEESDWATLEVSMPKNKIINPFERFLEDHPYMFPILRKIFGN
jgi:outer membrane protein assembly factor BamB